MTESLYPEQSESISLKEFIAFIDENPMITALKNSEYKPEYFTAIGAKLAQLALNRHFLTDILSNELKEFEHFQMANDFKPSTIIIHRGNGYTIRAVIWMPLSDLYPPEVFSYFEPHDHNFDFFTVGYAGPGYKTKLFEYDYDKVKGVPGEEITIKALGETNLTQGKVMYYYGSKDAHIQYPPESLTVSLNLLLPKTYPAHRRQYEFELINGTDKAKIIMGNIDRLAQQHTLLDTAANIGDSQSIKIIRKIALNHENDQLRAIAWSALFKNGKGSSKDRELAIQDKSEYVRAFVLDLLHKSSLKSST
jgi:hypothetical protein